MPAYSRICWRCGRRLLVLLDPDQGARGRCRTCGWEGPARQAEPSPSEALERADAFVLVRPWR